MILLVQRRVKWRRKVYVAQVGQRPRVVAYRYLLSRWLRARVYAVTKNFAKIATNSINSRRNQMKILSDVIPRCIGRSMLKARIIKPIVNQMFRERETYSNLFAIRAKMLFF